MNARYAGKCHNCSKPIEVGMPITWNRAIRGSTAHVDCLNVWSSEKPSLASITREDSTIVSADSTIAASAIADAPVVSGLEHAVKSSEYRKAKTVDVSKALADVSPNAAWYQILDAVLPHVTRILLVGPPATGKSTTAMKVANCKYRVTMTETTSREDLIGMFHLIDGETKWIDGPITSAMRNGETVLVDEIDRYSPESASLLYALIDDKPHLALPNGDMLYAAQGYKMIMTSNEGLDTLPVAVQDRIEVILSANEPHEDAISDLPKAMQQVTTCYYRSIPKVSIKLPTTVRRMRTLNHLLVNGMQAKLAAQIVFGNSAEILSVIASAENSMFTGNGNPAGLNRD